MPSNKLLSVLLFFPAALHSQVLPPLSAAPSAIAADSDATKVTLSGYGFAPGLVVQWNGQPRATEFLDASTLRVTLTADDLAVPTLGALAVWDPALQAPISDSAIILVYLAVWNNDLIYDSLRARIYIAVSKQEVSRGASIAILNPATARIEGYFPVDAEPEKLAISADGRYLYAGLGNLIRRIDLLTWTADLDIPLGNDTLFGVRHVLTMVVLPQTNTSLAVSFRVPGLSPQYVGTAVFDGAKPRAKAAPGHPGPEYLIGGPDDSTLYAADGSGTFYTLKLDSSGVVVAQAVPYLCGLDGDPVLAGGLIYTGWGSAIDPAGPSLVNTFGAAGLIRPVPDQSAVLILGNDRPPGYGGAPYLSFVDTISGSRFWSLLLPGAHLDRNRGPLIHWGANGIAFRDNIDFSPANRVYVFRVNLTIN